MFTFKTFAAELLISINQLLISINQLLISINMGLASIFIDILLFPQSLLWVAPAIAAQTVP